jgi:hypothetical protein
MIIVCAYIYLFGVNVPFLDEWTVFPLLDKFYSSHLTLADLFLQHNESHLFFPQMIIIAMAGFTQYNLKDEMWMSFFTSVISFLIIAYIYFNKNNVTISSLLFFVPISFLFFGLFQFENIIMGFQLQVYLCVLGVIASLFFISRSRNIDMSFIMAILFGVLATFSFFNGLLVWPIVFVYLMINKKFKQSIIWAFFLVASYVVYFYGWAYTTGGPSMSYLLYNPATSIAYFIANTGAPSFPVDVYLAFVLGIVILLFYVASFALAIKDKSIEENQLWFSLILFSLGTSVLCMIGRSGYGIEQALSSRYTTFTILGIIGVYAIIVNGYLKRDNRRLYKPILVALLGVIVIGLVIGNAYGLYEGKKTESSRQGEVALLNNYDNLTNSQAITIYPDPAYLNSCVEIMKKYHITYGT